MAVVAVTVAEVMVVDAVVTAADGDIIMAAADGDMVTAGIADIIEVGAEEDTEEIITLTILTAAFITNLLQIMYMAIQTCIQAILTPILTDPPAQLERPITILDKLL